MNDATSPQEPEEKLGVVHENLQGWIPAFASEAEIRSALEKAFDYRGDLTVTLKDGRTIEGYVFDRRAESPHLNECTVRMMPKDGSSRVSILYSDIQALAFTGKDTAAGKSFEAWVRKYNEKKARGEKDIGIESEPLE
ncbi:MAG: hypothetical protein JO266_18700 [Acidobacteria bacterium]|nr:hypothetical protein [Acidobacteriota bacterium]